MSNIAILYDFLIVVAIAIIVYSSNKNIQKAHAKSQEIFEQTIQDISQENQELIKELEEKLDRYYISCKLEKLCFIGIGGGGCNIVEDISHIDPWHDFIHLNSDLQALQQKSSRNKILMGYDEKGGLGCGGKVACGAILVNNSTKKQLFKLTKSFEQVYVIATFGGGVGSGSTANIVEYLKLMGKDVTVVVTLPFLFEGNKRIENAKYALKELQYIHKDTIVVENEEVMQKNKLEELGTKETFQYISRDIYLKILQVVKYNN